MKKLPIAALALLLCAPALAVQPDEMLKDPALEARARVISKDLRCLVCQNQSIDDSDAPLARDLRVIVRERVSKGDSNAAVVDYVVSRYGEFVLLNPRFGWHTLILWALPVLVLLGGLLAAYRRRTAMQGAPSPLSAEEEARLKTLLDRDTMRP